MVDLKNRGKMKILKIAQKIMYQNNMPIKIVTVLENDIIGEISCRESLGDSVSILIVFKDGAV